MKMKFQDSKTILNIAEHEIELSSRADEIDVKTENKLMREIISALKHTIELNGIVSLSAPAIGYQKRIFCIKFDEEIKTFINPVICLNKGVNLARERCTSIPEKEFLRPRNSDITVIYQKPTGQSESRQLVGLAAVVFQHEMDHIDGVLLSDIGLEIDQEFDNASDDEKAEVVDWYLKTLDLKSKEFNNDIQTDPELKQMDDAIRFMKSVYTGETKIE